MKILVTGAAGFIGFHLIKYLLKSGHVVTGIDNCKTGTSSRLMQIRLSKLQHENFTFYKLDINNLNQLQESFDLIINLAAQTGVRHQPNQIKNYLDSNINGFISICDFCEERKIKNVIYASSSSVYSDCELKPFKEDHSKTLPKSLYGLTKLFNEKYAKKVHHQADISFIGLRFFSVYGPYGRPDMAYFSFTNAIKKQKTIRLHNKGKMLRDMTYIDDIVQGLYKAIDYITSATLPVYELFNLGCNDPVFTEDLLKKISKELKLEPKVEIIEVENESNFTHADLTKSRSKLGYNPSMNFDFGIEKFLEWHRNYEKS